MTFDIENLMFEFNTEFETTPDGFLKPILWATDLNFGDTTIYHDNFLLAMIFD